LHPRFPAAVGAFVGDLHPPGYRRVSTGDAEAGGVQLVGDDAFPAGQRRVRYEPELPFTDVGAAGVGELVDGYRQCFIHRLEAPGGSSAAVICRVSSASSPTHSIRSGRIVTGTSTTSRAATDTDGSESCPAARRSSQPRCRHVCPHHFGIGHLAATATAVPQPAHGTDAGRAPVRIRRRTVITAPARSAGYADAAEEPADESKFSLLIDAVSHHNAINSPQCTRCVASWVVVGTIGWPGKFGRAADGDHAAFNPWANAARTSVSASQRSTHTRQPSCCT